MSVRHTIGTAVPIVHPTITPMFQVSASGVQFFAAGLYRVIGVGGGGGGRATGGGGGQVADVTVSIGNENVTFTIGAAGGPAGPGLQTSVSCASLGSFLVAPGGGAGGAFLGGASAFPGGTSMAVGPYQGNGGGGGAGAPGGNGQAFYDPGGDPGNNFGIGGGGGLGTPVFGLGKLGGGGAGSGTTGAGAGGEGGGGNAGQKGTDGYGGGGGGIVGGLGAAGGKGRVIVIPQ